MSLKQVIKNKIKELHGTQIKFAEHEKKKQQNVRQMIQTAINSSERLEELLNKVDMTSIYLEKKDAEIVLNILDCKSELEDFAKVYKTIISCKTIDHIYCAKCLIESYNDKYKTSKLNELLKKLK